MKKQNIDYAGIEPENIDEFLFEIIADRGKAEREIAEKKILLKETTDFEAEYQGMLRTEDDQVIIAKIKRALEHNDSMKNILCDRLKELEGAIKTFDGAIERLRS